ncbi:MAG: hypothetical protein H0S82_03465 [Anaerolineaceae bacterium]|nr:hypothetical protein [Anaerolineaceae bacterium]
MQKVILGGVVGGLVTLIFAISLVFVMNSLLPDQFSFGTTGLTGLVPVLLAPMAGGFLSGLLAKEQAKQAGWITGGLAGTVILIGWIALMGFNLQTTLRGVVLCMVVAIIARLFSGFAQPK